MNRRLLWMLLALTGLTCSESQAPQPTEAPPAAPSLAPAADARLARLQACAAAEVQIERLRKVKPQADWPAITALVEQCAFLVQEADRRHGQQNEAAIREALKRCAAGERPKLNQQTLAKGLQLAAVRTIQYELDGLAAPTRADREQAAARVAAIFEGIRPTFTRRDADYFGGTKTLEAAADRALQALRQAAASGAAAALGTRRDLDNAISRTYALSVLYEIQGIAKLRDTDRDACDVKRREAEIFYAIIQPRMHRADPRAEAALAAMLAADYPAFDVAAATASLEQGLPDVPLR